MSKQGTIIVVDDNKGVLSAVKLLLKNHFEHIVTLPSPITLPAALREENAQVVLLDMNFSSGLNTGNEGLYWLHEIKKIHPSLPVVLFTAYADIDLAVRGIKEGATDFIVKPWDNARLIETLLSACHEATADADRESGANGCQYSDYRRERHRKRNAGAGNTRLVQPIPAGYDNSGHGCHHRIPVRKRTVRP